MLSWLIVFSHAIITRAWANALIITCRQASSARLVNSILLESASLGILMWKSLARLVFPTRDFQIRMAKYA